MNDPKPGWTLSRALDRLAQGYSAEHVSRLSGYAVPFLHARLRGADHGRVPSSFDVLSAGAYTRQTRPPAETGSR